MPSLVVNFNKNVFQNSLFPQIPNRPPSILAHEYAQAQRTGEDFDSSQRSFVSLNQIMTIHKKERIIQDKTKQTRIK